MSILQRDFILENRYKIVKHVKSGGMGAVYKALDSKNNKFCAVKELLNNFSDQKQEQWFIDWFKREAIILSKLKYPNLPEFIDYFISDKKYYIVMEFIEGEDLDCILRNNGSSGIEEKKVISWGKDILKVLSYLHTQKPPVVYRDIKPGNIIINKDSRAILVDFGIARIVNDNFQSGQTKIGTKGYVPIEQIAGKSEPRSDIYSLGATMHHLLTGKAPDDTSLKPLGNFLPSVSKDLENILIKALEDNLNDRFATAMDMYSALNRYMPDVSTSSQSPLSHLDKFICNYKIFADVSVFLHKSSEEVMGNILFETFKKNHIKLIIPKVVVETLINYTLESNDDKVRLANRGLEIIKKYQVADIISFNGEKDDEIETVFVKVFTIFLDKYNLCLLTQNEKSAGEVLKLNNGKSKRIVSLKLTDDKKLLNWENNHSKSGNNIIPFNLAASPVQIEDKALPITFYPKEKDRILTSKFGSLTLVKKIAEGGEGIVYETDNKLACKLYSSSKLTTLKKEKLKLMLSRPVHFEGLCWPLDMVYNEKNEFAGYLMDIAKGVEMQKCLFIKTLLFKHFPKWTKLNLVNLCITILGKIHYLHKMNVIMGDINPLNILIKNSSEVCFVDTDSYQIEGFPCPVGTINYTAPEIQGKSYSSFLRTFEHEHFAVATLLFMILLPGKPPYSHQGGADPAENIKSMNFSYPCGEFSNKKAPDGSWRFIWSHLPRMLKNAFYDVFRNNKRLSVEEWIDKMRAYKTMLEKGHVSDEIFPTGYKVVSQEAIDKFNLGGRSCICSVCGIKFHMKDEILKKLYDRGIRDNFTCFNCRNKRVETGEHITCCSCGRTFVFTESQKNFFEAKGLEKPKRCKDCRIQKKSYSNTAQHRNTSFSIWDNIQQNKTDNQSSNTFGNNTPQNNNEQSPFSLAIDFLSGLFG